MLIDNTSAMKDFSAFRVILLNLIVIKSDNFALNKRKISYILEYARNSGMNMSGINQR